MTSLDVAPDAFPSVPVISGLISSPFTEWLNSGTECLASASLSLSLPPSLLNSLTLFLPKGFCRARERATIGVKARERTRSTHDRSYARAARSSYRKQTRGVPSRPDTVWLNSWEAREASTESSLSRSSRDWVNKGARSRLIQTPTSIGAVPSSRERRDDRVESGRQCWVEIEDRNVTRSRPAVGLAANANLRFDRPEFHNSPRPMIRSRVVWRDHLREAIFELDAWNSLRARGYVLERGLGW